MAKAYPLELRREAVARVEAGESRRSVAADLKLQVETLSRWHAQFKKSGTVEIGRSGNPKLTSLPAGVKAGILAYRSEHPDATGVEIWQAMRERYGTTVSHTYVNRLLRINNVAPTPKILDISAEDRELLTNWIRETPQISVKDLRQRYRAHRKVHLNGRLAQELRNEIKRTLKPVIEESKILDVIRAYRYRSASDIVEEITRRYGVNVAPKTIRKLRAKHGETRLEWQKESPVEWGVQRLVDHPELSNADLQAELLMVWNVKAHLVEIEDSIRGLYISRGLHNPLLKGKLHTHLTMRILERPEDAASDIYAFIRRMVGTDRVTGKVVSDAHIDAFLAQTGLERLKKGGTEGMPRTTLNAEDRAWLIAFLGHEDCAMRKAALALLSARFVAISPNNLYRALSTQEPRALAA